MNRLLRIISETGWKFLGDIRPDTFLKWRSRQVGAAKTVKEYQISLSAFLNYLVELERLERNPLAKIKHVPTRGRERRPSRHYTEQELSALFAIHSDRVRFYQTLFYTAGRKGEVASLVWGDFSLNNLEAASVTFRANVTKTKRERVVPLALILAQKLRFLRGENYRHDAVVFQRIPTRKQLLRDLSSAGIERRDALNCVVHFHAFRKTARTLAIAHGVSERVCDAILGHESEHRMGTRYTDMRGVPLSDWLKLPWLGRGGDNAQLHSLVSTEMPTIRQLVFQLVEAVKVHSSDGNDWSGRRELNAN